MAGRLGARGAVSMSDVQKKTNREYRCFIEFDEATKNKVDTVIAENAANGVPTPTHLLWLLPAVSAVYDRNIERVTKLFKKQGASVLNGIHADLHDAHSICMSTYEAGAWSGSAPGPYAQRQAVTE